MRLKEYTKDRTWVNKCSILFSLQKTYNQLIQQNGNIKWRNVKVLNQVKQMAYVSGKQVKELKFIAHLQLIYWNMTFFWSARMLL